MTARFDNRVLSALRFEMIFCLVKCDARALLQMPQHFLRKVDVPIQARADRSSPRASSAKTLIRFCAASFTLATFCGVAGNFLPEPNGRRSIQRVPPIL